MNLEPLRILRSIILPLTAVALILLLSFVGGCARHCPTAIDKGLLQELDSSQEYDAEASSLDPNG